jgi:hypothetical protein
MPKLRRRKGSTPDHRTLSHTCDALASPDRVPPGILSELPSDIKGLGEVARRLPLAAVDRLARDLDGAEPDLDSEPVPLRKTMTLKLWSGATVASLAAFMMLDAGAVQAADGNGACSFSERTSVWGGDCRPSVDDPDNRRFGLRVNLPVNIDGTDDHHDGNGNGGNNGGNGGNGNNGGNGGNGNNGGNGGNGNNGGNGGNGNNGATAVTAATMATAVMARIATGTAIVTTAGTATATTVSTVSTASTVRAASTARAASGADSRSAGDPVDLSDHATGSGRLCSWPLPADVVTLEQAVHGHPRHA